MAQKIKSKSITGRSPSRRTFIRGQNVMIDPETHKELEEKRRRHLEHQEFIKQQVRVYMRADACVFVSCVFLATWCLMCRKQPNPFLHPRIHSSLENRPPLRILVLSSAKQQESACVKKASGVCVLQKKCGTCGGCVEVEEKQRLKREERDRKIREELEEEAKLQAERDRIQNLYQQEQQKQRNKEVCAPLL